MPDDDPFAHLPKLTDEERSAVFSEASCTTPEQRRAEWEDLRRMADEGLIDFDRATDLNKSVDEGLLQEAMKALRVDTRTEAINQALRIAIDSSCEPKV